MRNKIILFIVEGITDEDSLALILNRLLKKHNGQNIQKILFKFLNGDITTGVNYSTKNVKEELVKGIKSFLSKNRLQKEDIYKIVQLTDMDGAYVPNEVIISCEEDKIVYKEDCIYYEKVENKISLNQKKQKNLNELSSTAKIFNSGKVGISYEIYYFSCNLDHVTSNIQNADDTQKKHLAKEFSEKYSNDLDGFVEFFKDTSLFTGNTYEETWNFIKKDTNSLKRYTNFYIFIDKLINNIDL